MRVKSIEHIHYDDPIPVYDIRGVEDTHNFAVVGESGAFVAHNCDEINFSKAGIKDIVKAKEHVRMLYTTVADRIKGTFRMGGEVWGKQFAISSKRSDSDFMEDYVRQQLEAGAGDHMYIDDKPQWEVLPKSMFHRETFYIAVGDRYHKGFVIPDNQTQPEAIEELKSQGFQIMEPPIDMKPEFTADFDIALRDLAGIAVPGALSFITQQVLLDCIGDRTNPFYNEILQIGVKDSYTLEEFFHAEVVDPALKTAPMYIHLDLSLNTDKTGISGVALTGRKDVRSGDSTISMPTFSHVFSVSLEAPRGDKIPYDKITAFLVYLRGLGFNIKKITRDQFQSEYMAQLLEGKGFDVGKISLDRTPDGYQALRAVLVEERVDMLNVELLQQELIHLQRDSVTGKVDHPIGGCFTGDTKIALVDGRDLTILELMQEQEHRTNWVYTVNEDTLDIEAKPISKVFRTKFASRLVEVTLGNKSSFTCTPEHRIMLTDGTYVQAQSLLTGFRLMPLNRKKLDAESDISNAVVAVRVICSPQAVYDLSIQDNPNFALSADVFVHNSKDMADSFAGAVWMCIQDNPGVAVPVEVFLDTMRALNGGGISRGIASSASPSARQQAGSLLRSLNSGGSSQGFVGFADTGTRR